MKEALKVDDIVKVNRLFRTSMKNEFRIASVDVVGWSTTYTLESTEKGSNNQPSYTLKGMAARELTLLKG